MTSICIVFQQRKRKKRAAKQKKHNKKPEARNPTPEALNLIFFAQEAQPETLFFLPRKHNPKPYFFAQEAQP